MANNVVNKTVNVYIQSGEAQKALDALIRKEDKLKESLAAATDPKQVERLTRELNQLQEPIERARKKLSGELSPSLRDVQTAANALGNRLRRMSEEDADFSQVVSQYRQASAELDQQRTKVGFLQRAMKSFWQEAKTVAVGVLVGNTVESALQAVAGYLSGMITGSAKIADELSDIEKTTGLTTDQVRQINSELTRMDTRTSGSELRRLAAEAGKLGAESTEDVRKFVEQADKINVALGEDLGEGALLALGKLSKIFKVEMLNIGSAINEIGAKSEASEGFAVDFLNRLAGTGPAVKLSADQLLGYGAALEVAGQTAEVSGTALSTFFIEFVRDADKFGKTAGFAKGELQALINTKGTNAAFLEFLERMKENNPSMNQFLSKMQQLGIDGSRGANVLLALANNIESVRKQQDIANGAIQNSSSIMNEFNKKNFNAAAELDKLRKNMAALFTSSTIQDASAAGIRALNNFIGVLKGIPRFIKENESAIKLLVLGIVLLNGSYIKSAIAISKETAVKIYNAVATRAIAATNAIAAASTATYSAIVATLTGRLNLATVAGRLWGIALSTGLGPLGILITLAGAAGIALYTFISRTKELTAEQRIQADVAQRVADSTTDTVEKMRQLTEVASNNAISLDNRKKALAELIAIAPDYLNGLTLENLATAEGKKILDEYIVSLRKKAEIEAKNALLSEKLKQRNQAVLDRDQAERNLPTSTVGMIGGAAADMLGFGPYASFDKAKNSVKSLDAEIKVLQADVDAAARENITNLVDTADTVTDTTNTIVGDLDKVGGKAKKTKDDLAALAEELRRMALDLLPDGVGKQIELLMEKYDKLRQRAQGNARLLAEIERLYGIELNNIITDYRDKSLEQNRKYDEMEAERARKKAEALLRLNSVIAGEQFKALAKELPGFAAAEKMARLELNVLQATGRKKLQAQKALLEEEKKLAIAGNKAGLEGVALIEEQFRKKEEDLEREHLLGKAQRFLEYGQQVLNIASIFTDAATKRENAELERDRKLNDKKKSNLDRRLKDGVVSQMQYDRDVREIEKQQEAREKQLRIKQFRRNQAMQLAQAALDGGSAVLTTLKTFGPPVPPNFLGIAAMAFTAATIIAKTISIAKQKPPEFGRGGGFLVGPSHQAPSRGMPVTNPVTGQIQAFLEGGEGIASKRTMGDPNSYTISGTPSQIMSYLNGVNGGVTWTTGAVLRPAWQHARPVPMNFSRINESLSTRARYYATGGVFAEAPAPAAAANDSSSTSAELVAVIQDLVVTVADLRQTVANLQARGIQATVGLSSLEDAQARKAAIREDATMR